MKYFGRIDSPVGPLRPVVNDAGALVRIAFAGETVTDATNAQDRVSTVIIQLNEYFAGKRRDFDLELEPIGSEFQHQVWELLCKIPYGETRSYGQIAAELNLPNASRAVGRANGTNPIPIVVPCHRVIGADGSLTGYGGGLEVKRKLLELERPGLFDLV